MYTFLFAIYQGVELLVLGSSYLELALANTAKSFSKVIFYQLRAPASNMRVPVIPYSFQQLILPVFSILAIWWYCMMA